MHSPVCSPIRVSACEQVAMDEVCGVCDVPQLNAETCTRIAILYERLDLESSGMLSQKILQRRMRGTVPLFDAMSVFSRDGTRVDENENTNKQAKTNEKGRRTSKEASNQQWHAFWAESWQVAQGDDSLDFAACLASLEECAPQPNLN